MTKADMAPTKISKPKKRRSHLSLGKKINSRGMHATTKRILAREDPKVP